MSRQNAEIVRRFYAAWARDDVPGPVEHLDTEVEYVNPPGAIEPGVRRGLPAFTQAAANVLEAWEFWRADLERVEAMDDRVVALVHYRARGRGSGLDVEGRESALWTFHDGKVVRYQWFHGPADAFTAAGLEQPPGS